MTAHSEPAASTGDPTEVFEEQRSHLFAVAYRMLGSAADAEDMVQEAWIRWQARARDEVDSPRAYLVRIVTNLCLDQLRRPRREAYIGPWLPEPVLTAATPVDPGPEEQTLLRESLSFAFLLMLETLTPVERAVFLLHDVFAYQHGEVATAVGKSSPAVRQMLHRARERIAERRPRFRASYSERIELTHRFFRATATGDVASLLALLVPDAVSLSDGGGLVPAARFPIVGAERVAKLVAGLARYQSGGPRLIEANGFPAFVIGDQGGQQTVIILEPGEDHSRLATIYSARNPGKLAYFGRQFAATFPEAGWRNGSGIASTAGVAIGTP